MTDDADRVMDDVCTNDPEAYKTPRFVAGERLFAGDYVKVRTGDGKVYRATQAEGYEFVVWQDYEPGEIMLPGGTKP